MSPLCQSCRQPVDETDCYCRHCGRTLRPRMGFWYSHVGILLLTAIVGPFALICVWMSRQISLTAKWLWTLLISAFTYYLCYCIYKVILLLQYTFFPA